MTAMIDEARKLVYCQAIIDTRRWVGVWKGRTYECVAYPDTGSLAAGDMVFCHVLPGTTELVAVLSPSETLYFSPGWPIVPTVLHPTSLYGVDRDELWKYKGTGIPTLVWTVYRGVGDLLDETERITYLFWTNLTGKLYICTWCEESWENRIYELDPATDAVTLVYGPYTHPTVPGSTNIVQAACEWGGKIYLGHQSYMYDAYLLRFDPTTYAMETVHSFAESFDSAGGLGLSGGYIYWLSGGYIHRSASGNFGSWSTVWNLWSPGREWGAGGMVTDPANDVIYFTCIYDPPGIPDEERRIYQISTPLGVATKTMEHLDAMGAPWHVMGHARLTYSAGSPTGVWVMSLGAPNDESQFVYIRQAPLTWQRERCPDTYFKGTYTLNNQGLTSLKSKLHALIWDIDAWPNHNYGPRLFRRDGQINTPFGPEGVWASIQDWVDYDYLQTWHGVTAMTLARTDRLCHET